MKALTLILTFSIIVVLSHATPTMFYRHRPPSHITKPQNGTCKYTITVEIRFLPQADTKKLRIHTESDIFTQNGTNIFKTTEPCLDKICKVRLAREPLTSHFLPMKWIADYVTIEDSKNPPITFNFPNDTFGFEDYRSNYIF
uniref:Uncharacterized protein LOC105852134 isoform X2 n=1 Tax=Cicer arietinum TaxID=3827 RepID=A0A3Q7XUA9_CICAR|nr:uncharacterized protein LOC105852134 isoform X2 [Cicer arietinum]